MKRPANPLTWSASLRDGDPRRRDAFLESHVDLVRYLALRIASRLPASVEVDDLVHDGIVGLLDAFDKFDPEKGVRFRTYAELRVRGAILDGLRQKDWRPRSVRLMQRDLDATVGRLASINGRAATEDEICQAMGMEPKTYRSLLQDLNSGPLLSLEDVPNGRDPMERSRPMLPDSSLERRELIDALSKEVVALPERDRRIMELYYHEELNMKEIGAVLGVTESRVCQLHAQAASRLRVALRKRLHARPVPNAGAPSRVAVGRGGPGR